MGIDTGENGLPELIGAGIAAECFVWMCIIVVPVPVPSSSSSPSMLLMPWLAGWLPACLPRCITPRRGNKEWRQPMQPASRRPDTGPVGGCGVRRVGRAANSETQLASETAEGCGRSSEMESRKWKDRGGPLTEARHYLRDTEGPCRPTRPIAPSDSGNSHPRKPWQLAQQQDL